MLAITSAHQRPGNVDFLCSFINVIIVVDKSDILDLTKACIHSSMHDAFSDRLESGTLQLHRCMTVAQGHGSYTGAWQLHRCMAVVQGHGQPILVLPNHSTHVNISDDRPIQALH
jgi:hypothetical protein